MEGPRLDKLMRYERKYVLNNNMSWRFKDILFKKNFKNVFFKRKVKSLYFDTIDYLFFKENIEGVGYRMKPRIRWYENLYGKNNEKKKYIFEIKRKKGFVGTKEIFNINFIFDLEDKKINLFKGELSKKISAIVKKNVEPVLVTSYDREYFLNYNKKLRATIDTNLSVKHINNKSSIPLNNEIMEIKYNKENDDYYRNTIIDTNFNFRFQKYSKYVSGILRLKKNGFI